MWSKENAKANQEIMIWAYCGNEMRAEMAVIGGVRRLMRDSYARGFLHMRVNGELKLSCNSRNQNQLGKW